MHGGWRQRKFEMEKTYVDELVPIGTMIIRAMSTATSGRRSTIRRKAMMNTTDEPEIRRPAPPGQSIGRGAATKERIVDAASDLFYAQGLRAVSADKIIERAGITKVTFYRHFPTKDDLIVAYLERRAAWERLVILAAIEASHGEADEAIRLVSDGIGLEACSTGFRGCPFINAAAEYPDATHPVRKAVDSHRSWYLAMLNKLTASIGIDDPTVADELMMLRDGAMVTGHLGDAKTVGNALLSASRAVLRLPR